MADALKPPQAQHPQRAQDPTIARTITALTALLTIAALAIPIVFVTNYIRHAGIPRVTDGFWQAAVASWLATLIAVGAGLPVGLWVSRRVERESTARQRRTADSERRRELRTFLLVLIDEIEIAIRQFAWTTNDAGPTTHRIVAPTLTALVTSGPYLFAEIPALLVELTRLHEEYQSFNEMGSTWLRLEVEGAANASSDLDRMAEIQERLLRAAGADALLRSTQVVNMLRDTAAWAGEAME